MNLDRIIRKPIITEKSLRDASLGIFTFEIDVKATKQQIKKAIEKMYKVHVKEVTTSIIKGRKQFAGKRRIAFTTPDRKKTRVKLKEKESIELFEVGK